jgi:hypothetical protein
MQRSLRDFPDDLRVYVMQGGVTMPDGLVVVHERTDGANAKLTPALLAEREDARATRRSRR